MINTQRVSVIGAHTNESLSYGLKQGMPWPRGSLNKDMLERFKPLTSSAPSGKKNLLIAGMTTFKTFQKPLPNRHLLGVTKTVLTTRVLENGSILTPSFEEALAYAEKMTDVHTVFFIGGKSSWEAGLRYASHVYITVVHKESHHSDTVRLDCSLENKAKAHGFTLAKAPVTENDDWDGNVRVDFLDYTK